MTGFSYDSHNAKEFIAHMADDKSILLDIKKQLGYDETFDPTSPFDSEIIMHINGSLAKLTQVGVGPKAGFRVTDDKQKWSDFLTGPYDEMNTMVQEYVFCKVKLAFDPPASSAAVESLKGLAEEDIWRIREKAEGAIDDAE